MPPVALREVRSSLLDALPTSACEVGSALLVRDLDVVWRQVPGARRPTGGQDAPRRAGRTPPDVHILDASPA